MPLWMNLLAAVRTVFAVFGLAADKLAQELIALDAGIGRMKEVSDLVVAERHEPDPIWRREFAWRDCLL